MKVIIFVLALLFSVPSLSFADEEIYPGFNECNARTETMGQENACWDKAIKYWSPKLDKQYLKIRKACAAAPDPDQCRAKLKKMQLGWLNYTNGMAEMLKNGLLDEQDLPTTSSIYEALIFEAWATRRQYEALKMLE